MSDKQLIMAKSIFRKKLYSVLNSLPEYEITRQSNIVSDKVIRTKEFQRAKTISVYLSMDKEIQTQRILEQIFKENKECFIPRFQSGGAIMEMTYLSSMEQYHALPTNKWNIKQLPVDEKAETVFERGQLDLVLTPGLAFTPQGHRLGRGKGYYDKFFESCKRKLCHFPYTIGLAFKEQIFCEIPTEEHDFCLDLIIGPE